MKTEILQQLNAVLGALNSITVSGKQNLTNLSGSIDFLERITMALSSAEIIAPSEKEDQGE